MKTVCVNIDRPIGYIDTYNNIYKVNYGYVKGIFAGDNEEQDVYVLGLQKPINFFRGKVIAYIKRYDDNEDKWVSSLNYVSKYRILMDTEFIEKYFNSEIVMKLDFIDFFEGEISKTNVVSSFINFLKYDAKDIFECRFEKDTIVITFDGKNNEVINRYFGWLASKRIKVKFLERIIKIDFNFGVERISVDIYEEEKNV